jgi:PhnB protein
MADNRHPTVVPMLSYEDPAAAIPWLERAFGFREQADQRITERDGRVTHAQLEVGDGLVMLANPTPRYQSPGHHRTACAQADSWLRAPFVIDGVLVHVPDVEAHRARAEAGGAKLLSEIEDGGPGRLYRVEDVEGHRWMFLEPRR